MVIQDFVGVIVALQTINMPMEKEKLYTVREEQMNTWTHALGILLGVVASFYLLTRPVALANPWATASVWVYLFGMMLSYVSSTFYHGSTNVKRKSVLQKIDHAAIYVHIAGTYTPFTLVTLMHKGYWGWALFTFVWLSAIIGTLFSFRKMDKHSHIETICYVVMGCSVLIAFKPLIEVLSASGSLDALYWLIAGGVSYIVGALFYSFTKIRYMHSIFHLFVLGGSVCHIIAIYLAL